MEEELRTNLLEKFESRDSVDLSLYNFSSSPLIGASHEDKTKDDNDELKKETDVIAEMGEMGKDKEVHVEKAVQEMNLEENDRDSDEKSESPGVDKGREEMSDSTDINDLSRLDVDFDKCLAAVEEVGVHEHSKHTPTRICTQTGHISLQKEREEELSKSVGRRKSVGLLSFL